MKRGIIALVLMLGVVFVFGQNVGPIDLILLLDTSSSMSDSYQEVNKYMTGGFLREYLRIGDTFHLIPFSDKPRVDIARRVEGRGDIETIVGRMLLQYPLDSAGSDIQAALGFAETYAASLPARPKKIVFISDGEAVAFDDFKARLGRQDISLDHVRVSPGRPLANLPRAGRPPMASSRPAQTPAQPARPAQSGQAGQAAQSSGQSTAQTPAQSARPAQSGQSGQAAQSSGQSTAQTPAQPVRPAQSGQTGQAAQSSGQSTTQTPAQPARPAQSGQAGQTAQSSGQSTAQTPAQPARPAQSGQAGQTVQSSGQSTAQTPAQPARPAQSGQTGQTAQSSGQSTTQTPAQPARPAQSGQAGQTTQSSGQSTTQIPGQQTTPAQGGQAGQTAQSSGQSTAQIPGQQVTPAQGGQAGQTAQSSGQSTTPIPGQQADSPVQGGQTGQSTAQAPGQQAVDPAQSGQTARESPGAAGAPSAGTDSSSQAPSPSARPPAPGAGTSRPIWNGAGQEEFPLLIIGFLALGILAVGLIIFLITRRLQRRPNQVMAQAAAPRSGADEGIQPFKDHSKDLASFAARQSKQRVTPYADRKPGMAPSSTPSTEFSGGPLLLNLFVEDQNTFIGKRNIHALKSGYRFTVGGGKSDFLIFLVPIPEAIGEVRRDGNRCTFIPRKAKYFPDLGSSELPDCIGKTIRIISDKDYEIRFRLERYEDPLLALNRLLNSVKMPG